VLRVSRGLRANVAPGSLQCPRTDRLDAVSLGPAQTESPTCNAVLGRKPRARPLEPLQQPGHVRVRMRAYEGVHVIVDDAELEDRRSFLMSDLGQEVSEEPRHLVIDEGESVPRCPCYVVVDAVAHSPSLAYRHRQPSSV
jgi:hypothetical protein